MDEMKLKLSTGLMKGFVAKMVKKAIFKQTGCEVDIRFDEFEIETKDGMITLHANVDGKVKYEDFRTIIKGIE